jgi:hypothetical protein
MYTRFLQSFNIATIYHFQSEGIDKIWSTWLKQIFIQKRKLVWMDIPFWIKHGDSPKLNFGYLVGVSSFWWWVEHPEACSGCLDGFVKKYRYGRITCEDHVWFEDRWMVASLCDVWLTTFVWTGSSLSIAGAGCGLTGVGAGEEQARKVVAGEASRCGEDK